VHTMLMLMRNGVHPSERRKNKHAKNMRPGWARTSAEIASEGAFFVYTNTQ
jgi:hypothetical protein